jgi:hypothetical protein
MDEKRKTYVLKPKMVHMDVSQLCGDPSVDRFFSNVHLRARYEEHVDGDYSEVIEYFQNR